MNAGDCIHDEASFTICYANGVAMQTARVVADDVLVRERAGTVQGECRYSGGALRRRLTRRLWRHD
jgi:hypothetical protein